MALTIECNTNERIDLEEFVRRTSRYLDSRDESSIVAAAKDLRALANNKGLIVSKINDDLMGRESFQGGNGYTAQTMVLAKTCNFLVRANLWVPPSSRADIRAWQSDLFYYRIPHDHNFTFLTIGYWGSGYETTIWEYDPDAVAGKIGESVALRFLERTSLPQGKIMMYRAGRDVHSQEHPSEFSISVNLMIVSPEVKDRTQYLFDTDSSTINGYAQHGGTSQVLICQLAKYFANDRTIAMLEEIAATHGSPRVRAAALESQAALCPGEKARILEGALLDASRFVRSFAAEALDRCEVPALGPANGTSFTNS